MVESPGTTEIGKYNTAAASQCCHEDVLGLEVPMDNVLLVKKVEGHKNLSDDNGSLNFEQFPVLELDKREEVSSSYKILEDVSKFC